MMQSYVIDVAGTFAGAAIRTPSLNGESFRFVAVDPRVEALDQNEFPSLDAVRQVVARVLRTGRLPAEPERRLDTWINTASRADRDQTEPADRVKMLAKTKS